MIDVDGDMSDDSRYPNNNWTGLGNVMVDEVNGDIMVFMTTLKTAQKLFRSKDHARHGKLKIPLSGRERMAGCLPLTVPVTRVSP